MIIETALGMQNVYKIATASKRNESLHFGIADYAASTKAKTTGIGTQNPKYSVLTDPDSKGNRETVWSDMWHYPLSRMVIAARAAGLRPVDGPFGEIQDPDAYESSANRAAVLGCEGKWAIHPSQIGLANKIFTPPDFWANNLTFKINYEQVIYDTVVYPKPKNISSILTPDSEYFPVRVSFQDFTEIG